VLVRSLFNTGDDRVLERMVIRIVLGVQPRLFDKFPAALNQIQMGRIRWQKQ
jgi:hypothetical protein